MALLAASTFLLALAMRLGGGVAGTDQFWYAGDLLMTAETGRVVSNHVYPLFAATAPPGTLPPRMHDTPVTHLASWVFGLFGGGDPGAAWIAVDLALVVAAAVIVVLTSRIVGGSGGWGAAAFLLFPTTTWAVLSPVAEASLAFGVAVLVGAVVAAERSGRAEWWLVSGVTAGMLVWSRSNFVLLLLAWFLWLGWAWRGRRVSARVAGASALVAVGIAVGHAALTEPYPNAGLAATLMVGAKGASSNMDFYFVPVAFDAGAFAEKLTRGVWRALTPRTPTELSAVLPVVVACVAGFVALGRRAGRDPARSALVFFGAALLVTYVATCGLFQPQTRYLYAAAPVAAMLLDVAVSRVWRVRRGRLLLRTLVAAASALVVVAGVTRATTVADTLRVANARAAADTQQLRAALEPTLATGGPVMALAPGNASDIAVAYSALPHPVISVDPKLLAPAEAARLAREWRVTSVVGRPADAAYVGSAFPSATPLPTARSRVIWAVTASAVRRSG